MDEHVYKAKLAEQAERYEEMVESMKEVAKSCTDDLSLEERNLLSVAVRSCRMPSRPLPNERVHWHPSTPSFICG